VIVLTAPLPGFRQPGRERLAPLLHAELAAQNRPGRVVEKLHS
jgi:hypothetical protein